MTLWQLKNKQSFTEYNFSPSLFVGDFLVCINKNSNLLKVVNLFGKLEDFSYYVSVLNNTLTVIYDNYIEEIQINLKEASPIVTWNYSKIK